MNLPGHHPVMLATLFHAVISILIAILTVPDCCSRQRKYTQKVTAHV